MTSAARTVREYSEGLEPGRREVFERLRAVIAAHLPPGFEERMSWGMPTWAVPLSRFPAGYLGDPGQPLPLISLAWQKRHLALYHMGLYGAIPGRLRERRRPEARHGQELPALRRPRAHPLRAHRRSGILDHGGGVDR